ncbi:MAG: hypothetical protein K0Q59_329 [Paenibacillus sp.]|nr:hypothetical protein [Paenibacillus sp.]
MSEKAKQSLENHAAEIAEHTFEISDYHSSSELSRGLAETHEQISDAYAVGTSDGSFIRGEA